MLPGIAHCYHTMVKLKYNNDIQPLGAQSHVQDIGVFFLTVKMQKDLTC